MPRKVMTRYMVTSKGMVMHHAPESQMGHYGRRNHLRKVTYTKDHAAHIVPKAKCTGGRAE